MKKIPRREPRHSFPPIFFKKLRSATTLNEVALQRRPLVLSPVIQGTDTPGHRHWTFSNPIVFLADVLNQRYNTLIRANHSMDSWFPLNRKGSCFAKFAQLYSIIVIQELESNIQYPNLLQGRDCLDYTVAKNQKSCD
jgi:hypothetical protein